jgi:site-specific recombinase XerC
MTNSFSASIEGYRDWLPYSGKRKGASIRQYTRSAEQLAAWARQQGRQGFEELTRADLRAFLNTLHGRGGGPPSPHWKSAVWYGIKSLFGYLADEEDCKDITQKITVSRPSGSGRATHLDAVEIDKLLAACSDPRELAVISVFLDAGVRIAEAAQLKVADVLVDDLRSRRLIVTGKGPKTRVVVIGSAPGGPAPSWTARRPRIHPPRGATARRCPPAKPAGRRGRCRVACSVRIGGLDGRPGGTGLTWDTSRKDGAPRCGGASTMPDIARCSQVHGENSTTSVPHPYPRNPCTIAPPPTANTLIRAMPGSSRAIHDHYQDQVRAVI